MRFYFFLFISALLAVGLISCSEGQLPTTAESDVVSEADDLTLEDAPLSLAKGHSTALFELKLENLTPATADGASQPFSPPVIASHGKFRIFQPGKRAPKELAYIAEDAINGPMVERLSKSRKVFDVVEGDAVILPGSSGTYMLELKHGYTYISVMAMLVNSNDAFTGKSGIKPPRKGSAEHYLWALDAGTEANTEKASDIPGPCCGSPEVRVPTHEKIRKHRGIKGTGDLDPAIYGWRGPVAKLTITRVH